MKKCYQILLMILCLLPVSVTTCGNNRMESDPEYWLDYDNGISQYQDAVYCTTYTLHDDDKAGYVLHDQNLIQNTNRERLYDRWGKKAAEVSYEYIAEMPWCVLCWCSFAPGFETAYLFLPVE